jgi:mannose-6-phosphate isomerase
MLYLMNADNFVPLTRTPWAGTLISKIKSKNPSISSSSVPQRIGESWEVSTEPSFPSSVTTPEGIRVLLTELLEDFGAAVLGQKTYNSFGANSPLLLKWLNASEDLSVQVHPNNSCKILESNECGKPESWLVLDVEPGGYIYLGFKENFTKEHIETALKENRAEEVMNKFYPKKFDFIFVPPGCVHAVGPGVLIVEPQYVLPKKLGVTWRLGDWGRTYNAAGEKDSAGKPRPLHFEKGLQVIYWNLPRGNALLKKLVSHDERFEGSEENPFAYHRYAQEGSFAHEFLAPGSFSLLTVWAGEAAVMIVPPGKPPISVRVPQGQSLLLSAEVQTCQVILKPLPLSQNAPSNALESHGVGCAFFAFRGGKTYGGV